ncbi:MAG: D-amino-acid transaminase [bacterium]|nr:D-amino-acid transaminase [bacterium]
MSKVKPLPVLDSGDVIKKLADLRNRQKVEFYAFYSSHLGGIVTDSSLMVIPFDDHMVHRGHGIFDTAAIVDGKIYDLEAHLDRFLRSAKNSKLRPSFSRDEMRDIIIQTTAVSGKREGSIRYWLSAGTGSLGLLPVEGADCGFFVMIFAGLSYPERYYTKGMTVVTTSYPIKRPVYATTKSNNYLPNALMQMEAKEKGADNGIFLDDKGFVGEGSNMNVAFVTSEGILKHPRFDNILSGCTSLRLLELAPVLVKQDLIKDVQVCDVTVEEGRAAKEMMFWGSSIYVAPIVEWDGRPIGDGKPGPVCRAFYNLLMEDMRSGEGRLIEIPH